MLFQLWLIQAEDTAGHADPCDLGAPTLFMHLWVADCSKSFQKYWMYYSLAQNNELLHVAVVLQRLQLYFFFKDLYLKKDGHIKYIESTYYYKYRCFSNSLYLNYWWKWALLNHSARLKSLLQPFLIRSNISSFSFTPASCLREKTKQVVCRHWRYFSMYRGVWTEGTFEMTKTEPTLTTKKSIIYLKNDSFF